MPPRRRAQDASAPFWLIAAAATSIAGGAAWAWYTLRGATPTPKDDQAAPPKKSQRAGPKQPLSLATPVLPPIWLVSRIAEDYNIHLIFPSHAPFPPPPQYFSAAFDPRRLLFHETSEGLTHLARVVGGTLVLVRSGIDGDPLPAAAGTVDEVEPAKLAVETRAFVRDFVLVDALGEPSPAGDGRTVKSWEGLAQLLEV